MSMTERTPGPLEYLKVSSVGGDTDLFFVGRGKMDRTPGNEIVAEILSDEEHVWGDAEFIVRACNNHEALAEALKRLEVRASTLLISTSPTFSGGRDLIEEDRRNLSEELQKARAALKAAGIE